MSTGLSRKLVAIQDLKKQYYLGTADAKRYLDVVDGIPRRIEGLAAEIQARQPLATPHSTLALAGVYDYLESVVEDVFTPEEALGVTKGNWARWCCTGELELPPDEDEDLLRLGTLKLSFEAAPSTMPRDLYGAAAHLLGLRVQQKLGAAGAREFSTRAEEDYAPQLFSSSVLRSYEAESRHYALKHCLNTETMAAKLRRDHVLHRMDYTRPLITLWAEQQGFEDADEAVASARSRYRQRKEQLERFEEMRVRGPVIDLQHRMVSRAGDILALAQREHKYLEKYFR